MKKAQLFKYTGARFTYASLYYTEAWWWGEENKTTHDLVDRGDQYSQTGKQSAQDVEVNIIIGV